MRALKTLTLTYILLIFSVNTAFATTLPTLKSEAVFTLNSTTVKVDGVNYKIDSAPYLEKDRTFLPFRYLGEILGAEVAWDEVSREATLELQNGVTLILKTGELFINDNGKYKLMDVVPAIVPPGRICLPARYVVESAGYNVFWEQSTQQMIVKKKG